MTKGVAFTDASAVRDAVYVHEHASQRVSFHEEEGQGEEWSANPVAASMPADSQYSSRNEPRSWHSLIPLVCCALVTIVALSLLPWVATRPWNARAEVTGILTLTNPSPHPF